MKNYTKKVLLTIVLSIIFINSVSAATVKVNSVDAPAETEGTIKVELEDTDIEDYNGVSFQLSVSGDGSKEVSIVSVNINNAAASFYKRDGETYFIDNRGEKLSASVIATIKYKTSEKYDADATIAPVNVKFYNTKKVSSVESTTEDEEYEIDTSSYKSGSAKSGTIKYSAPKSKEAYLTELYVGDKGKYEMSPSFDKDTLNYSVTVPDTIKAISINATAVKGASNSGADRKELEIGKNGPYEVVVTAEDGETKKTYKVTIIRGEDTSPSAYLTKLTINNIGAKLSPSFDKLNNKYTVTLTKDISKLDIKYDKEDVDAEVEIEGNEDFVDGKNIVTITVTASDNSDKQVYELIVNKEKEESKSVVAVKEEKEEPKKNNIWLIIAIVAGIVIIVGLVAFVLFRKKKNSKSNKVEKTNDKETNIIDNQEELEKTTRFEANAFTNLNSDEELEKTKEFNMDDFK